MCSSPSNIRKIYFPAFLLPYVHMYAPVSSISRHTSPHAHLRDCLTAISLNTLFVPFSFAIKKSIADDNFY